MFAHLIEVLTVDVSCTLLDIDLKEGDCGMIIYANSLSSGSKISRFTIERLTLAIFLGGLPQLAQAQSFRGNDAKV